MNFLGRIIKNNSILRFTKCQSRLFSSDPMRDRETSMEKSFFNKEERNLTP